MLIECWDSEPNNRPSMHEIVKRLKTRSNYEQLRSTSISNQIQNEIPANPAANNIKNLLHGELSQVTQNLNTKEIESEKSANKQNIEKIVLPEKDLSIKVSEIVEFIIKIVNEGIEQKSEKQH